MKLFGYHDTPARQRHRRRRHAIQFAIVVAVLALAWLGFHALIRLITLD